MQFRSRPWRSRRYLSSRRSPPGGLAVSVPLGARLFGAVIVVSALAAVLAARPSATTRAIAAGRFYGVADAAIKAISVRWSSHGPEALISGWTVLALAATFAGFLSFQAALRTGSAVPAISLMTAFAALVALACGVFGFGESLGTSPRR